MVNVRTLLNVFSTLACLAAVAPLFLYLDPLVQLIFPCALLLGLVFDRRRWYPLTPLPATLISIVCVAVYILQISRTTLVEPVVNSLVLLLAVRLLTEKNGRNYLQIFVLAIFTLAGSSLLTLSMAFFAYLLLLLLLVTLGLVLLSFYATDPELLLERAQAKRLLSFALLLPAGSLPLMLLFFAILPRTEHAFWNMLNPPAMAASGFSDQVRPGQFATISPSRDVAFRVSSEPLAVEQRYWRTIVLNTLDGSGWMRTDPPGQETLRAQGASPRTLEFYGQPRQGRYLPTLDLPLQLSGLRYHEIGERIFTTHRTKEGGVHYRVTALPGGQLWLVHSRDRDFYLLPPGSVSDRVRAVARRIASDSPPAAVRIERLQSFFRDQQLRYADNDLPGETDPVDEFLFEKKRGYCAFFASSFAQILRLAGVPSRLVGGYYGGEYNRLGGYYLVTEEAAHVWVEALLEDNRWLRIDPSTLADNAGEALLAARSRSLSLGRRLLDGIDYLWTQAVLTYDFNRQFEIARGTQKRLRQQLPKVSGWRLGVGLLLLGLLFWAGRNLRWQRRSRNQRILDAFLRQVKKRHRLATLPAGTGLFDLARQLNDPLCREFAELYGGALYRDQPLDKEKTARLKKLIRELGRLSSG